MPGEKTESASPKKRRDERKKGNVLMCKDVTTVSTLFATTCALWFTGGSMVAKLQEFFYFCANLMRDGGIDIIERNGSLIAWHFVGSLVSIIAIPFAVTLLVSIGVTMYQTKLLVTTESIKPKLSKLDPISGFKNLFALKNLVEALKNICKIIVLFYIIIKYYMDNVLTYRVFFSLDPVLAGVVVLENVFTLMMKIGVAFAVIAFADYFYQKWEYERKLKMSKEDLKEEYKQMEGDPKVKGKIKQKQRQLAESRMMNSVPTADVIVRNPTHYAAALRYKRNQDVAPVILALGEDELALRIIKVAERHNIPVVEDVPLARALYATGSINSIIPEELYNAVAKVMIGIMGLGAGVPAVNESSKNQPIPSPKPESKSPNVQNVAKISDRREIPMVDSQQLAPDDLD